MAGGYRHRYLEFQRRHETWTKGQERQDRTAETGRRMRSGPYWSTCSLSLGWRACTAVFVRSCMSVGSCTPAGGRPTRERPETVVFTKNLKARQRYTQNLNKRCQHGPFSNAVLFGFCVEEKFRTKTGSNQAISPFLGTHNFSKRRRYAAVGCANAQDVPSKTASSAGCGARARDMRQPMVVHAVASVSCVLNARQQCCRLGCSSGRNSRSSRRPQVMPTRRTRGAKRPSDFRRERPRCWHEFGNF